MANDVIVHYNDEFLPEILLLTQDPIAVWFDDTIIVLRKYIITTLLIMYHVVFCLVCLGGLHGD